MCILDPRLDESIERTCEGLMQSQIYRNAVSLVNLLNRRFTLIAFRPGQKTFYSDICQTFDAEFKTACLVSTLNLRSNQQTPYSAAPITFGSR